MKIRTLLIPALALTFASAALAQTGPEISRPAHPHDMRNWPTPVWDMVPPPLPAPIHHPAVLIFSKTNGYRDLDQIPTAAAAITKLVDKHGWTAFATENAAVFTPELIRQFDVVVFNSTSGDIFSPDQRAAFRQWLEAGGGFVALHGAGGDPHYAWQWYVTDVIGAQFTIHTHAPQFQQGRIIIEDRKSPIMRHLGADWTRTEEWYSFAASPRGPGAHILASLDESSYDATPELRMGDHPLIWERCVGKGRVFFSALGHQASAYAEKPHLKMIDKAIMWAARRLDPDALCPGAP
jgi:type 1 glutamine amidotransferase